MLEERKNIKMALGDNNKKQNYENTFYSRLKFTNYDEKKMLSFSYWKGNLKVTINGVKESATGIEYEELSVIYLSTIGIIISIAFSLHFS